MSGDKEYAGDVSSAEAFGQLSSDEAALLIDVRTRAEWTFVGVPDLRQIGKEVLFVEWQSFPPAGPNEEFVGSVTQSLDERGMSKDTKLFFLCRSGARSQAAAIMLTAAGFENSYNVADGFEGPLNSSHHRGKEAGWKVSGLPWVQN